MGPKSFLLLSLLPAVYAGIGPTTNLEIVNKFISPDGFNRSTVLAGQTAASASFPGPLITGYKGDNFQLNVVDGLTNTSMLRATSIHWHGIFQAGTPWADGPPRITLPIPLDDTVITLADWYHTPAPDAGLVPTADATLINGQGRYSRGPSTPLAVITVTLGKRYRFRLVSVSCDPNYAFSIDEHTMTIIEADGQNVEPLTVDSIQIFAGQRYSFVLNANQPVDNYWIRAIPSAPSGSTIDGGLNSAILRYVGAPAIDPNTTQTPNSNPLVETNLHPLTDPTAPGVPTIGDADVAHNLVIAFNASAAQFTINGAPFIPPTVPVLLQILSGASTAQELLPPGSVYTLPRNKVIEVSIPGGTPGAPHAFSVIRSAGNSTPNFVNPVRRDVVSTGPATTDNVTIRFTTDNPGPWIFHCGLAIVFAEDVADIATLDPPQSWDDLCPAYNANNPDVALGA
ncbi:hypothetical protein H0H92_014978 [Tricholoma furcatifolium]|nr:hypothetical protein H0H92_014978 [Tricholoma furcatifolium]